MGGRGGPSHERRVEASGEVSGKTMKALLSACALTMLTLAPGAAPAARAGVAAPAQDSVTGFLDVSSEPPGARILIDDGDVGQTTPQHRLPVRVGHHRLTLVTGDGAHKLTVGFTVEAGQTKKLTLYLAK